MRALRIRRVAGVSCVAVAAIVLLAGHGCSDGGGGGGPAASERRVAPQADPSAAGEAIAFVESTERFGEAPATEIALGDVDGDGAVDIVAAGPSGVRVFVNDGAGAFSDTGQTLGEDAAGPPFDLALGDLDRDGDLDLVAAFFRVEVVAGMFGGAPDLVFLNDGAGRFTDSGQRIGRDLTTAVVLGDIDGDEFPDMVTGEHGPNRVRFNDGAGRFPRATQSLGQAKTEALAMGDLDGDGDLDVVEGTKSAPLSDGLRPGEPDRVWFRRDAPVGISPSLVFFSDQALDAAGTHALALGDIDGDGSLDIVAGGDGGSTTWVNDGAGSFLPCGEIAGATNDVELAALDRDADLDLARATDGGIEIRANRGDGVFTAAGAAFGPPALAAGLADLDGDGLADLVAGTEEGVRVFMNRTP